MRHKTFARWLLTAWTSVLVLGCRTSAGRLPYPADPLLARKAPVEGKADSAGPVLLAHAEPAMPVLPPEALAARTPPARMPLADHSLSVPATPTSRASPSDAGASGRVPLQATPAVRQKHPSSN